MTATPAPVRKVNPLLKVVLEMGPLVLFFLANSKPVAVWLAGRRLAAGKPAA